MTLKIPALAAAVASIGCLLLISGLGSAQVPAWPPPDRLLSPNQLDNLVAPVALYPDPLLSQVLVASTYPLEVVQAYQWLQMNPRLQGPVLTQAAQQQNWDASIQALVMFPDVLKRLNDDITWTTNLGNAFLAQQQDVMEAIQRMRVLAQQSGALASTPQANVIAGVQDGQVVVQILPVDPNIIYVPVYDPSWVWGPALWYPYPRWYWPPRSVIYGHLGFGFGAGINVGFFFGAGWHGWGGWGWHPGWDTHNVIVNNIFIHEHNFNAAHTGDAHGSYSWHHDAEHRQGVPYARPDLNERYRSGVRQNLAPRPSPEQTRGSLERPAEPARSPQVPWKSQPPTTQPSAPRTRGTVPRQGERAVTNAPPNAPQPVPQPSAPRGSARPSQPERLGNREILPNAPPAQSRSAFGGQDHGRAAQTQAEHGFSSIGAGRNVAPRPAAPVAKPTAPVARPSAPVARPSAPKAQSDQAKPPAPGRGDRRR